MLKAALPAFTLDTAPAGNQVASRFPWWKTAYQKVTTNNLINDQFVFRAPQGNAQAFANDKPWPVYIDEIRFWYSLEPRETRAPWLIPHGSSFRIKTDLQSQLVSHWMPERCFSTVPSSTIYGESYDMLWHLPAPYYLPFGSQFSMELLAPYVDWHSEYIQCALQGYDPNNEHPLVILSKVTQLPDGTATPIPSKLVLSFDSNRDRPIRNMWLQKFSAAFISRDSDFAGLGMQWRSLEAKFHPPEGPEWTLDETTPLIALCDQKTLYSDVADGPVIIHKPASPYILRPGDAMTIEAKIHYDPVEQDNSVDHRIWAHVRGWQLGEGM